MHLSKGTQLHRGKYTIVEFLGQGGFGITYHAKTDDGRDVAIKEFFMKDNCVRGDDSNRITVLTESARADVERYHQKFIKEANNLLLLDHPNIVKVYDVFEENDTDYYVMQYVAGGSFRDYVLTHGPMDEARAKNYILQVASALDYMHIEKHLCHYDVKPGNILVDGEKAMLIDFGLSKNYDASGQQTSSTPVGISTGYAPLEQYQQSLQEFSPATDIYALGATLYFLLSGQNPPEASVVLERGLMCPVQMSQNTWAVISQAMQPVRKQRFQMVGAFSQALSNDATLVAPAVIPESGQETQIYTTSDTNPPARSDNKKSLMWMVVGLLALLLVILGIVLLSGKKKSPAPVVDETTEIVDTTAVEEVTEEYDGEVAEENPIDVTEHMDWKGNFIIKGKSYPVRLEFWERYDQIMECTYTNVSQGGMQMSMTGSKSGNSYTFSGHDGSNPLVITVSETYSGHYEGNASGQFEAQAVFDKIE